MVFLCCFAVESPREQRKASGAAEQPTSGQQAELAGSSALQQSAKNLPRAAPQQTGIVGEPAAARPSVEQEVAYPPGATTTSLSTAELQDLFRASTAHASGSQLDSIAATDLYSTTQAATPPAPTRSKEFGRFSHHDVRPSPESRASWTSPTQASQPGYSSSSFARPGVAKRHSFPHQLTNVNLPMQAVQQVHALATEVDQDPGGGVCRPRSGPQDSVQGTHSARSGDGGHDRLARGVSTSDLHRNTAYAGVRDLFAYTTSNPLGIDPVLAARWAHLGKNAATRPSPTSVLPHQQQPGMHQHQHPHHQQLLHGQQQQWRHTTSTNPRTWNGLLLSAGDRSMSGNLGHSLVSPCNSYPLTAAPSTTTVTSGFTGAGSSSRWSHQQHRPTPSERRTLSASLLTPRPSQLVQPSVLASHHSPHDAWRRSSTTHATLLRALTAGLPGPAGGTPPRKSAPAVSALAKAEAAAGISPPSVVTPPKRARAVSMSCMRAPSQPDVAALAVEGAAAQHTQKAAGLGPVARAAAAVDAASAGSSQSKIRSRVSMGSTEGGEDLEVSL